MNKMKNTLIMLCSIAVLAAAGVTVLAVRASQDAEVVSTYHAYIGSARERAEKGINYYAKQDYLKAFSIYNEDQELFLEFLNFLEQAEDSSYPAYLKIYMERYPQDPMAYEKLCETYYENGRYKEVQTIILNAQAVGVSTDALKEYKDKVDYEFVGISGSYADISPFYGRQAIITQNGCKGLYYYDSGVVLDPVYEELSYYINGALAACKGGEWYFIDLQGNKSGVTQQPVEDLSILSNDLCVVSVDGKYGYTDSSLQIPESLPYEDATPFSSGIAAVKADGKWGIIDTSMQYIVTPQYEDIVLTSFGTCMSAGVIFVKENGGYIMLNAEGERLNDLSFDEVCPFELSGQPAAVKLNGSWTFVKNTGELFETDLEFMQVKSFHNYLAPVTLDGEKWGYMDGYGNVVIEPQFDDCLQFSEYGIAPVKKGESWSLIQLIKYRS